MSASPRSVALDVLARTLDGTLEVERYDDYAPNGLQVEGRRDVTRVVTGVSANAALLERALALGADAIVVHHGFFWRNEPRTLVGVRAARVRALMRADVSLLAYHLPLDGHATIGNNAQVLAALSLTPCGAFTVGGGLRAPIGEWASPRPVGDVVSAVARVCGQPALWMDGGRSTVRRVAVCTGGAAGSFEAAVAAGCDVYVTGEPSEPAQALAREMGVHFVAAGHHATERFGVRALAGFVEATFGIDAVFVDVDNRV